MPNDEPGDISAQTILDAIQMFREQCEIAEHTDTGEAWALLEWIESIIEAV